MSLGKRKAGVRWGGSSEELCPRALCLQENKSSKRCFDLFDIKDSKRVCFLEERHAREEKGYDSASLWKCQEKVTPTQVGQAELQC